MLFFNVGVSTDLENNYDNCYITYPPTRIRRSKGQRQSNTNEAVNNKEWAYKVRRLFYFILLSDAITAWWGCEEGCTSSLVLIRFRNEGKPFLPFRSRRQDPLFTFISVAMELTLRLHFRVCFDARTPISAPGGGTPSFPLFLVHFGARNGGNPSSPLVILRVHPHFNARRPSLLPGTFQPHSLNSKGKRVVPLSPIQIRFDRDLPLPFGFVGPF